MDQVRFIKATLPLLQLVLIWVKLFRRLSPHQSSARFTLENLTIASFKQKYLPSNESSDDDGGDVANSDDVDGGGDDASNDDAGDELLLLLSLINNWSFCRG